MIHSPGGLNPFPSLRLAQLQRVRQQPHGIGARRAHPVGFKVAPGMATWGLFRAAVRDCLGPAASDASTDQTAVCIWAALHGLLTLCRDRPSFSWPDLSTLIDAVLAAHLHVAGPQAQEGEPDGSA